MNKKLFIAGNWKSYKGVQEAKGWFEKFASLSDSNPFDWSKITAVLCPPYTSLPFAYEQIRAHKLSLLLGGQDVSSFGAGAYTGEINVEQLSEFATWTIIGHSERRRNLGETDTLLFDKVKAAKSGGLKVMYCVQDEAVMVPEGVDIIAYEPPWAISAVSGGVAQNVESANRVCEKIVGHHPSVPVIYGGSTTPENVVSFIKQPHISGVLPGGASMDPEKFFTMIKNMVAVTP